jgi:hypothetical protein
MIEHNSFILDCKKPNEIDFVMFYITDPERDEKYKTIAQLAKAMNEKIFIGGVFFFKEVFNKLKNNYFDRITYEEIGNQRICSYLKNNEIRKIKLPENININHFTSIIRDAGYNIRIEFKDKSYKKYDDKYSYNILRIKEDFQQQLYKDLKVTNIDLANEVFNKCWETNKQSTLKTQISFMKQMLLFKKIGDIF